MANRTRKNHNPFLLEEMAAYVEENGFTRNDKIGATQFMKDDKAIVLYGDKVSFRVFDAGESNTDNAEFVECSSFEGLSTLNINDWILLLHVVKMITIPQLIANLKKQTPVIKFNIVESLEETIQIITKVQKKIYTGMLILLFGFLFTSCNTERQVQVRQCDLSVKDGRLYFIPKESWTAIPSDTSFPAVQVRNTSVRKRSK
jgi:hypothetical protein